MGDQQAIKAQRAFQEAQALERQGRLAEARILCRRALRLQPRYFEALNLAGIIAANSSDPEQALEFFTLAVAQKPASVFAHNNQGNALKALKRYEAAIASYDRALVLDPACALAHNNRGNALCDLGQHAAAVACYDRALALDRSNPTFHYNRGGALLALQQHLDAVRSFDEALTLRTDAPTVHNNRALALLALTDYRAALAGFERAIALAPDYAEAHHNRGLALMSLQNPAAALGSFERALALKADYAEAWYCRGNAQSALGRHEPALESYARAITLDPQHADALNNSGNCLYELMRYAEALACYDRSLASRPDRAEVHTNRGNTLRDLGRFVEAVASYDAALALEPRLKFIPGARLISRMHVCDWRGLESSQEQLVAGLERDEPVTEPFTALALLDSPPLQKQAARTWVREKCPASRELPPLTAHADHDRIRIGYFSQDFRNHPVAVLAAELFELHDRARFEITAFSFAPASEDEMQRRLRPAFDRFLDLCGTPDREVALLARELEIDIAIDLAGFTTNSRMGVLAMRAAPLQVGWLGYLGTTAADYIDYLIADPVIIPPHSQQHYTEKIIYLPSYQPNDSRRPIAERIFSREELGLPPAGFVFCCFNTSYKISPQTFAGWMRILAEVPASVLWLLGGTGTQENLRAEAQRRGVDPARLVFGGRLPFAEYLARFRAADLFLDTLPYNAGTTASDALWAGIPVLTCMGQAFAARVAGSLLTALELPELITTSPAHYEQRAIELARDSSRLEALRQKLLANRLTTRLFDTPAVVRSLETAYLEIHRRHQAGLPPDHLHLGFPPAPQLQPAQTLESGNELLRRSM
jgi:predicted O-linked N-acetylglucosamine transferase (SPINDLY family)